MEVRARIENFIKQRGPSLPIHVAKDTGLSMLFAGAYMSDMLSDKILKISEMKVGGSPLYFIPGQEHMLENFHHHLGKLKDAFLLLKEKGVLRDEDQLPMIRVALRVIKDFAFPFEFNGKLYWKYLTLSDGDALEKATNIPAKFHLTAPSQPVQQIQPIQQVQRVQEVQSEVVKEIKDVEPKVEPEVKIEIEKKIEEIKPVEKIRKARKKIGKEKALEPIFETRKEIKVEEKPVIEINKAEKVKEKSKFVLDIIKNLEKEDIELVEEIEHAKGEYKAKVRIDSILGKMEFFAIAKDKKINENDLALAIQEAQAHKLHALVIGKEISKKAEEYLKVWKIVKFKKL